MMLLQVLFEIYCRNIFRFLSIREIFEVFFIDGRRKEIVYQFIDVLSIVVKRRVLNLFRDENLILSEVLKICDRKVNVVILFFGGIDFMVIVIFVDRYIFLDELIDFFNVVFMIKEKIMLISFNKKSGKQENRCEIFF